MQTLASSSKSKTVSLISQLKCETTIMEARINLKQDEYGLNRGLSLVKSQSYFDPIKEIEQIEESF